MIGKIHSIETLGTVDGPGIRYVVFLQGCPMRCQYCHNPDTWALDGGKIMEAEEILRDFESYRPFLRSGGLTVTGGEPLLQMDFLIDLLEQAKKKGIHTCIDTSGVTYLPDDLKYMEMLDRLMVSTDLVLLDIKHIDPKEHKKLTGHSNERILAFAQYLEKKGIPVWIRHVAVPGITMDEKHLHQLGCFLGGLSNIKALDVLPYHNMGQVKYEKMGIPYPLTGVKPLEKEEAVKARKLILDGMKQRLRDKK